jgi:hypothetical protein
MFKYCSLHQDLRFYGQKIQRATIINIRSGSEMMIDSVQLDSVKQNSNSIA